MAELTSNEHIGYRVNAKSFKASTDGLLTVYAERHNDTAALGEYGGDAYPVVEETIFEHNNIKYRAGIILAADGVGQAAYVHPYLEKKLQERLKKDVLSDDDNVAALSVFLRTLYGPQIFKEKNKSVYEYALRCFADVPPDGYFACNKGTWHNNEGQKVMPFYKRDSQSLGSRLTCVGLFLKFRNYVESNKITEWNVIEAEKLRSEIENYISGELSDSVKNLFSHDDAPDPTKRNYYFLANTVAAWFYVASETDNTVSAVALNCGDARCYVLDLQDGVRQISVDDAFEDGSMSAVVHFGAGPRVDEQYHDRLFHARIIRANYPCALLACSDGVYDTCPALTPTKENYKYSLPYGDDQNASDYLFECNLLAVARRSHSYEDFAREVVFNFYAQASAQNVIEQGPAGRYALIKRDDSGTLAARFFGQNNGLQLFEELRKEENVTSLDKLRNLIEQDERKPRIPYAHPHAKTTEEKNSEIMSEYATGEFKTSSLNVLQEAYPSAFDQMQEEGATTLWTIENCERKLSGFGLRSFFNNQNLVKIMQCAIEDWKLLETDANGGLATPADWKQYEHVLAANGMLKKLSEIKFGEKLNESLSGESISNGSDEIKLKLYSWFEKCFYGAPLPNYQQVIGADENSRPKLDEMLDELNGIYEGAGEAK